MSNSSAFPPSAQGPGDALGGNVCDVNHWGLECYKDEIIALYGSRGNRMKDLPQLTEDRLGIRASLKAYRIALNRWNQKRYVRREDKMLMVGILKKWERKGRSVQFRLNGEPYSSAKLQRFIAEERKANRFDENSWAALTSYSTGDIPKEIFYFDSNDPTVDLFAMDICPELERQQESNAITIDDDFADNYQKHISRTNTQSLATASTFRLSTTRSFESLDLNTRDSTRILTIEEPNGFATAALQSIWQWATTDGELFENSMNAGLPLQMRTMNLCYKHFGTTVYHPSHMDKLFESLLEDDRLQEAEEVAILAVDLSESWVGSDHAESWKAKGNLAYVHHEQGRYHTAYQLGASAVAFFKNNGAEFDSVTLLFTINLVNTIFELGNISEAKRLCHRVVESATRIYGDEHNLTLTAKFNLARISNEIEDCHNAREILENVTVIRGRQHEEGHLATNTLRAYIELANALRRLGLNGEAIEIQNRVERVLQSSLVTRSMWTLELVWSVGKLLYSVGHYMGAEQVFRNLAEYIPTRVKSKNHPKVVSANFWLYHSLYSQYKDEEATALNIECISILSEVLGPYNRRTLTCMSNLAIGQQHLLSLLDFEAKIIEVRDLRKLYLGENDFDTLDSERHCAKVMWRMGKWDDAWNLLSELRTKLKRHPQPSRSYAEFSLMKYEAKFFIAKRQLHEAAAIQEKWMALSESIFGKEHRNAILALDSLAISLYRLGRYGDAENLVYKGISRLSGSLGRSHPAVTDLKSTYASVLSRKNKWASAEVIRRQIMQEWQVCGEQHPYAIQATRRLARNCTQLGKFSEAEDLFKQAIKLSKSAIGETHFEVISILNDYARLMEALNRFQEARDLYEESWNMTRMRPASLDIRNTYYLALDLQHPNSIEALEGLANVLCYTGELSRSLSFRKQILSLRTQIFGPLHPDTILAISNLASTQLKLGELHEARILYGDSLKKSCSILGKWHPDSVVERERLGRVLSQLRLFAECREQYDENLNAAEATNGKESIESANAIWRIAELHLHQYEYVQAQEHCERALRILETIGDRSHMLLYVMCDLAQCYKLSKEFRKAGNQIQAAMEKARELFEQTDPIFLELKFHLAWIHLEAGEYYEAEILIRGVFRKEEQEAVVEMNTRLRLEELVARSMAGLRKFQDAITFLEDAISQRCKHNPEDPTALDLMKLLSDIKAVVLET